MPVLRICSSEIDIFAGEGDRIERSQTKRGEGKQSKTKRCRETETETPIS